MTIDVSYESTARFYDAASAAMPSLGPDAQFYEKNTCCTARASRTSRCSATSIAARFAATHPRSW